MNFHYFVRSDVKNFEFNAEGIGEKFLPSRSQNNGNFSGKAYYPANSRHPLI